MKIWILYASAIILLSFGLIRQIYLEESEEIVLPRIEKIIIDEEIVEEEIAFTPHIINDANMEVITQPEIDMEEVRMLAQLIQSEAGNQSYTGRVLVADVVLNRVDDSRFPNTIKDVIFYPGQFTVIDNGSFDKEGKRLREENVEIALNEMTCQERYNTKVLYFGTDKFNGSNFFKEDGHWFSY